MQEQQWQQEEQQEQRQPEQRQPEQRQSAPCDDSCGEPCELPDEAAPEDEIEALRSEVSDLETRLATVRADFYNYRRRAEDERLRAARRVTLDRVSDFLPVLDNLDRALDVPDDGSAVLAGVKMVRRQFLDLLKERGVTVIPAEGVNFDPSVHEAIETSDVDDPSMDGKVLSELSRGYRAEERVLRPARVIVGRMNSGAAARQHAATDIQEESR